MGLSLLARRRVDRDGGAITISGFLLTSGPKPCPAMRLALCAAVFLLHLRLQNRSMSARQPRTGVSLNPGILKLCCWLWVAKHAQFSQNATSLCSQRWARQAADELILTAEGLTGWPAANEVILIADEVAGALSSFEDACHHFCFLPLCTPQQDAEGINA